MAKTSKKAFSKDKQIKDKAKNNSSKKKNPFEREYFVNLLRLSQKEFEFYSNSSKIIVKDFAIKIREDGVEYEGKEHTSKNKTFNFALKKILSKIVLECCNPIKTVPIRTAPTLTSLITKAWKQCLIDFKT